MINSFNFQKFNPKIIQFNELYYPERVKKTLGKSTLFSKAESLEMLQKF